MKNIFEHHVREVHITLDRKLRMSVCNIDQAIHILEKIESSISELGPFCSEVISFNYAEDVTSTFKACSGFEKSVQSVRVSYVQKEKARYKDVFIIHLFPTLREGTTVIFNEDDLVYVQRRLAKLIRDFKRERDVNITKSISCPITGQMLGRVQPNVTKLIGEPIENRDGSFTVTEAFKSHLMALDKLGSEQVSRQSEPGCAPKQRDIFNERKEDE